MKPLSHVSELADGLGAVLRGVEFLRTRSRLWLWIAVPFVINLGLLAALTYLAGQGAAALLPDLHAGDWGWFDWLRRGLAPVMTVLYWIVAALAGLFVTLWVSGIVNAPFYDLLSEQVEAVALESRAPSRPLSAWLPDGASALAAASLLALRQLGVLAVLFLIALTGFGAPLFPIAGVWFAGYAQVDVTLARKRYRAGERVAWARRHRPLVFGLGLPIAVLPPLQPFGIVGATLLYLEDEDKS